MEVQILVGMIASGKSTYAANAAKQGNFVVVNDDDIVNLVHHHNYNLYSDELKILYKSLENTLLSTALALGKNVIVDSGRNVSDKTRRRWISLAKSFDCELTAVVFPMVEPWVHAKRRYKHDNRGLTFEKWLDVANHHYSSYVNPSTYEGFDDFIYTGNGVIIK